ncbi:MAG: hypothetical protein RL208_165 [Pseudomonadota bacterium]
MQNNNFYLRPFDYNDFDILFNILTDDNVIKFSYKRNENEVKQILDRYIKRYDDFGFSKFAVFSKKTNEFIGGCGFDVFYDPKKNRNPLQVDKTIGFENDLEIGYWFYKKFWGMGYATELGNLICNWIFDKFNDLTRVVAVTNPDNKASQRVLEKVGFKYLQNIKTEEYGVERFYVKYRD